MMYLNSGSDGRKGANLPPGEKFEAETKSSDLEKLINEFAGFSDADSAIGWFYA